MKKLKTVFICSECGYESAKWNGICPSCRQGNTMNEEEISEIQTQKKSNYKIFML